MVDQEGQNINNQSSEKAQVEADKAKAESQPSWQELAGVDPKEFDTPDKLAKSYKDARTGLAEQGQKIKEAEDFKTQITPVLKAIYGNPELYKQVIGAVEKMYGKDTEDKNESKSEEIHDPRVDELSGITEAQIIKEFEEEAKLNKKENAKEIKAAVGNIMKRWLAPGVKPSLQQLPVLLRDAWKIYKQDNDIQDEPEETPSLNLGFGTPRAVQATIDKMNVGSLSPQERNAADRMGISYEDYLKEKKVILSR